MDWVKLALSFSPTAITHLPLAVEITSSAIYQLSYHSYIVLNTGIIGVRIFEFKRGRQGDIGFNFFRAAVSKAISATDVSMFRVKVLLFNFSISTLKLLSAKTLPLRSRIRTRSVYKLGFRLRGMASLILPVKLTPFLSVLLVVEDLTTLPLAV